jgi:membrane-bound inhibitor of C-type lysozyme
MTTRIIPLLALVLLANSVGAAQAVTASYRCSEGTRLTADFSSPGVGSGRVALSIVGGGRITLPQKPSADGGRYANAGLEFWIKGNGATLTREGRIETCQTH